MHSVEELRRTGRRLLIYVKAFISDILPREICNAMKVRIRVLPNYSLVFCHGTSCKKSEEAVGFSGFNTVILPGGLYVCTA